jgi:hypothetical protein
MTYNYAEQKEANADINRNRHPWILPNPNAGKDLHCKCGHTESNHHIDGPDDQDIMCCLVPGCLCETYRQKWYGCPKCGELKYHNANLRILKFISKFGQPITVYSYNTSESRPLSSKWDEQWYKCVKCGTVYDRRLGLV